MNTLAKWDGKWCVRAEYLCHDRPEKFIHYWPIGRVQAGGFDLFKEGAELSEHSGSYSLRVAPYEYVNLYLVDGGKTKSVHTAVEPVPCPRIRKGIETQWNNGRWEKYLKANGWVAA